MRDLTVIELASVLAGPAVGQFFAELGAEVIKVEHAATGGDVTRSWRLAGEANTDRPAYFCAVNWGKKSITLDLARSDDREVLYQLVRRADIVIASYKPGDATRLGVDYETLRRFKPDLIYGMITGYGATVPRLGYDAVVQAESGFMYLNGEAGGDPLKMPVALIDVLAAHQMKEALLLGLLKRLKTGAGSWAEVSLFDSGVASLVNQATNWLVAGVVPERRGSLHPNIAPYGEVLRCSDGRSILLAVGNNRQFADLCAVLGVPALAASERFIDNQVRVQNRGVLAGILAEKAGEFDSAILLRRLHDANVPAGTIHSMDQVFSLPEARALVFRDNGFAGVRSFIARGDVAATVSALHPPPGLGEHTAEIRAGLSR